MKSFPLLRHRLLTVLSIAIVFGLSGAGYAQTNTDFENTSWQLVAIHGAADSVFIPRNPESYLLRFRLESRLQVEADCNQAGATYAIDGESLTLTDLVTTRKLCISPTLFNRYILNLIRAESMRMEGDNLIVQSDIESDWMEFEPYIFVPGVSN